MPGEPNVIRELVLAELRCACHRAKSLLKRLIIGAYCRGVLGIGATQRLIDALQLWGD